MRKLYLLPLLIMCCSCEPYGKVHLVDYCNTVWQTKDDSELYIKLSVNESGKMSSIVSFQERAYSFSNYSVSTTLYFKMVDDEEKMFSMHHNYVCNESYICCKTLDDFSRIFKDGKEDIEVVLYKQ